MRGQLERSRIEYIVPRRRLVLCGSVVALVCALTAAAAPPSTTRATQPAFPIRAAFYYPWFPEAWRQSGLSPFTRYTPSLGLYDSRAPAVIRAQIRAMRYAGISAGIASWWGVGSRTDRRLPLLLSTTVRMHSPFRWAVYYEPEGQGDPSVAQIRSDLTAIRRRAASGAYLRVGKRFVVFVYAGATDDCTMADRWKKANTVGAYVVLKVFPGFRTCASQPDGWHQYAPGTAEQNQAPWSFQISPGFFKATETSPRLARDPVRWSQSIRDMIASKARFQLVATFNEWGEGTAVESAQEWASTSGYGVYLDALHTGGTGVALPPSPSPQPPPQPPPSVDAVLLAAGDIASCASPGDAATAALLDSMPGTIATLGDNAYERGSPAEYADCYGPTWGRFLSRTRPAPGNHEYLTPGASGYFSYFGAAAGAPDSGYYSYDLGAWHIVVINSNCSPAGGCQAGSRQEAWLRADLAAHRTVCTLAYWHHPRFSSGEHGDQVSMQPIWQDLYDAGADVVLSGHDHDYERFAPQTPTGVADPARGIREFVVGTGGKNHYPITRPAEPNSEVRNWDTFGILKLTLHPRGYDWQFVPEAGKTFTDAGSGRCH